MSLPLTFAAALFGMRVRCLIDAPRGTMLSVLDSRSRVYFTCCRWTLALVCAAVRNLIAARAPARLLSSEELLQTGEVVLRGFDVEDWICPATIKHALGWPTYTPFASALLDVLRHGADPLDLSKYGGA